MRTLKKLKKFIADYRHYRRTGFGVRRSWELARVTL